MAEASEKSRPKAGAKAASRSAKGKRTQEGPPGKVAPAGDKTPPPSRASASPVVADPKKDLSSEFAKAAVETNRLMASPPIRSPYNKKQRTAGDDEHEPCFHNHV